MIKRITAGVLLMASLVIGNSAQVDARFLNVIHQVETGGRTGAIWGDEGRSLGPLQISRGYFRDAAQYDRSLGNDWGKVVDLQFAQRVVNAYLKRYAADAVKTNGFEMMARVHNGGPTGYKRNTTLKYWNQVKRKL